MELLSLLLLLLLLLAAPLGLARWARMRRGVRGGALPPAVLLASPAARPPQPPRPSSQRAAFSVVNPLSSRNTRAAPLLQPPPGGAPALPEGWKAYWSTGKAAWYFRGPGGATTWQRPSARTPEVGLGH